MSEPVKVSSITKMLVGGGLVGLILWKTPIADLLYLFAMVVVVPLSLFAGTGLIGQGTFEAFKGGLDEWRARGKAQEPAPVVTRTRAKPKPTEEVKPKRKPTASTATQVTPAATPEVTKTPRRRGRPAANPETPAT